MAAIDPVSTAQALAANDGLRMIVLRLTHQFAMERQAETKQEPANRKVEGIGDRVDVDL